MLLVRAKSFHKKNKGFKTALITSFILLLTSDHKSFKNKTVAIVYCICNIYRYMIYVFGRHDCMIVSAILSEIPLPLYNFLRQDMLSRLHLVRLSLCGF